MKMNLLIMAFGLLVSINAYADSSNEDLCKADDLRACVSVELAKVHKGEKSTVVKKFDDYCEKGEKTACAMIINNKKEFKIKAVVLKKVQANLCKDLQKEECSKLLSGVEGNLSESTIKSLTELSCNNGSITSCLETLSSSDQSKDKEKMALFDKYCEKGFGEGCFGIGALASKANQMDLAMTLIKKSCGMGYSHACAALNSMSKTQK